MKQNTLAKFVLRRFCEEQRKRIQPFHSQYKYLLLHHKCQPAVVSVLSHPGLGSLRSMGKKSCYIIYTYLTLTNMWFKVQRKKSVAFFLLKNPLKKSSHICLLAGNETDMQKVTPHSKSVQMGSNTKELWTNYHNLSLPSFPLMIKHGRVKSDD